MRYKFNPYERAVGLFLTVTVLGSGVVGLGLLVKKNWFDEKVTFVTFIESASNLRAGSAVLMSGLKVGNIEKIELDNIRNVKVTFAVLKDYSNNITEGAKVQFVRPFIIGDKVLTVLQGQPDGKVVIPGSTLPLHQSADLMDVLSGSKAESLMARVDSILMNLDETLVIGKDIAFQVGDKKKLQKTIENLNYASSEVRKMLPHITSKVPLASEQLVKTIENLNTITAGIKEIQPQGSKKTIELLNESVITLQAMQKSFFLRSNVKEVKQEMAEQQKLKEALRLPASE
ncbi:MAG TPA: MlaD family protein [Bacteriovoracaceae bacterium]|nr:MlaD family protein [Bacteriovoracaceae bacterium]